jgi:hypothetical protein
MVNYIKKKIKSIYSKFIPFNLHPLLFWSAIGLIGFLVGEFVIQYYGEEQIFWTRVCFTINFTFLPPLFIIFTNHIPKAIAPLSNILWKSQSEADNWVISQQTNLLKYKSNYFRLIIIIAFVCAILTLINIGLPFNNIIVNILSLSFLFVFIIFNAHAAYFAIKGILISIELAEKRVKPSFYIDTKYPVVKLQNFYSFSTLALTLGYIMFTLGVVNSPYGITNELQTWLAGGAFFPPLFLFISFFQIHRIMQKIKYANLRKVNNELQRLYKKAIRWPMFNLNELLKFMEIQDKITSMKEWPFELQGMISLIISSLLAIGQLLSALGIFNAK